MDGDTFKEMLEILQPRITIPIHTEDKYKVRDFIGQAIILNDMEILNIDPKGECIVMSRDIGEFQEHLKLPQAQLIMLGETKGTHKSVVAMQIASNIARQNMNVAIFSLETSKQTLLERFGNIENIYIDDTPHIDITYMEEQTKKLLQEHNIKLIIIDYLQLMKDHQDPRTIERLKALAEAEELTIILLSLLPCEIDNRDDNKPKLEDIKNKTLRDLIDTIVFLYEEDINKIEMILAKDTYRDEPIITYEEVINRLKDKDITEYTKLDLEQRYIVYGTEAELQDPVIQHQLLKYNLYEELSTEINIITDKQIIQEFLQSDLFKDRHISLIQGKIVNIGKEILTTLKNNHNIYYSIVTMEDTKGARHTLKAQVFLEDKALDQYILKMKQYSNNVVAVVNNADGEQYIKCFLQAYEDMDYNKYTKSVT